MSKQPKVKVALVVPAYNEERSIKEVIRGLRKTFKNQPYEYQIVVVSDGSTDNTAEVAENAGAYVIRHILNSGSGGATATGLSYAHHHGFTFAATLDADGQHDPADVLEGVRLMRKGTIDLLIGSRLITKVGMSKVKILGNRGLTFITRLLFGIKVTDSQSGLRVFSSKALEQLKWETSGYEFCSEMLWRAKQLHMQISEFPIKAIYTEYSQSKGQNNWNGFNIVKVLLQRRIMELFGE